ncbi:MAG: translocation/assembly module TamB, partial [bacterium]
TDLLIEEQGVALVSAPRVVVGLARPGLTPPFIGFHLTIVDPEFDFVEDAGGWNVGRLRAAQSPPPEKTSEPGLKLGWLDHIFVRVRDGKARVERATGEILRISQIDLVAKLLAGPLRVPRVEVGSLGMQIGAVTRLAAEGRLELAGRERFRAEIRLTPLAAADVALWVPGLAQDAVFALALDAQGTRLAPQAKLRLTPWPAAGGNAEPLVLDLRVENMSAEPPLASIALKLAEFSPRSVFADAPPALLSGTASAILPLAVGAVPRSLEVRLGKGRIYGLGLDWLRLAGAGVGATFHATLDAVATDDALQVHAELALDRTGEGSLRGTIEGALTDPAKLGLGDELAATNLQFQTNIDFDSLGADLPGGEIGLTLGAGVLRGLPIRRGTARLVVGPERARLEDLELAVGRGQLAGQGWLQLDDSLGREVGGWLRGTVDLRVIPKAAGLLPVDVRLTGKLDDANLNLVVQTTEEIALPNANLRGRLDLVLHGLGAPAPHGDLKFSGHIIPFGQWASWRGADEAGAELGAKWIRRAGADGVTTDELDFDLDLARATEERSAYLAGRVTRTPDAWAVDVSRARLSPDTGESLELTKPAQFRFDAGVLDISSLAVTIVEGSLEASGRLVLDGRGASDLSVQGKGFDLGGLCHLAEVATSCGGEVSFAGKFSHGPVGPTLQGQLQVPDLRLAGSEYGVVRVELDGSEQKGLVLNLALDGPGAGMLQVDVRVPVEAGAALRPARGEPLSGRIRAGAFPIGGLRVVTGQLLQQLEGLGRADLRLTGTLDAPVVAGEMEVEDVVFSLTAAGTVHTGGDLVLRLRPDEARLESLVFDDGAIRASGSIGLGEEVGGTLDLRAEFQQARLVERSEATVIASGTLQLAGTLESPVARGTVRINSATLRPTLRTEASVARDPTIQVVRSPRDGAPWDAGVPRAARRESADLAEKDEDTEPRDGFVERLVVEIGIEVAGPVEIRRYDAHLRLRGAVEVSKQPGGTPRLRGEVASAGGWYIFQGRRLEITHASAMFSGAVEIDPALDISAQYQTANYVVTARITGTVEEPVLDLSSDPPLSQSDVLSVLLFGAPSSDINSEQGSVLQQQALAVLASYVAPELQRSVLDTFGWASLTFRMPTGTSAGSLGVGRYFGDDVFVSISQDFGGPQGGTARQLEGLVGSSITIQYRLSPSLTLQGASSTEGESTADFVWQHRY